MGLASEGNKGHRCMGILIIRCICPLLALTCVSLVYLFISQTSDFHSIIGVHPIVDDDRKLYHENDEIALNERLNDFNLDFLKSKWSSLPPGSLQPDSVPVTPLLPRIKYLKNTKNPCWLSAALSNSREGISSRAIQPLRVSINTSTRHRFRCLPYAFLAGFPKCGTTDLYQKLINHKTVRRPSKKEPHWWTRHRQNGARQRSIQWYTAHFDQPALSIYSDSLRLYKNSSIVTIDGSASTLWDNAQWREDFGNLGFDEPRVLSLHHIHYNLPDAKFLLLLRDPVDRLYSDYSYFMKDTSPEDFHQLVVSRLHDFLNCVNKATVRSCTYTLPSASHNRLRFLIGLYSVYIDDYLQIFPKKQIYFINSESYARQPALILRSIARFLDIGPFSDMVLRVLSLQPHSNVSLKNATMLPQTRDLLKRFYAPFNQRLVELTENEAFLWN